MALDQMAAFYREPLFLRFPLASVAVSALAFLAFAAPPTLIAAAASARGERYRIQRRRPGAQELLRPSLRAAVVLAWPLLRLSGVDAGPSPRSWQRIA
jgi:hypothetical protein